MEDVRGKMEDVVLKIPINTDQVGADLSDESLICSQRLQAY